jgi:pantoate--beta-alanine ligase
MTGPAVVSTVAALRAQVAAWRRDGLRVGMVPTMGALHDGHIRLTEIALEKADCCVVSIFVNPKQFAPTEDLDKYPRQLERDLARLGKAGVHLAFTPTVAEMYPPGFATKISLAGPALGLESDFRPAFFDGVATVVAKLFLQCAPDIAVFGEKDFQQLCVVRQMCRDLDIPVEIVGAPTIRDAHGLAMSSRNAYLDNRQLGIARQLNTIHSIPSFAFTRSLTACGLALPPVDFITWPTNQPACRLGAACFHLVRVGGDERFRPRPSRWRRYR